MDKSWASVEAALVELQGDDDGVNITIAHWPEFPAPWAVWRSGTDDNQSMGRSLKDALIAFASDVAVTA